MRSVPDLIIEQQISNEQEISKIKTGNMLTEVKPETFEQRNITNLNIAIMNTSIQWRIQMKMRGYVPHRHILRHSPSLTERR